MKDNHYMNFIDQYYDEAMKMLSTAKLFGEPVELLSHKECLAALYIAYLNKEYMYKEKDGSK